MESVSSANADEVTRLTPLMIFLLVIIVTGIPSNLFVCVVYRNTFTGSTSGLFIFALAVVDLTGCFVVTLEVINVAQQYTFTNEYLCKATIFLELVPLLMSGAVLLVISIARYRKVCHPFGWQLTVRSGKVLLGFSAFIALLSSWPALFLFGIAEVDTHVANLTGTTCSILVEYENSIYSRLFNGMFLLYFLIALTLLTVLYALICFKVMKHEKKMERRPNRRTEKREGEDTNDRNKNTVLRRNMNASKVAPRVTLTMGVISIVFVVSYLPYTILRLLEVFQKDFVHSMSDTDRSVYKTFLRTYFLNCAINPFIYCACSSKFRKHVMNYVTKFTGWCDSR